MIKVGFKPIFYKVVTFKRNYCISILDLKACGLESKCKLLKTFLKAYEMFRCRSCQLFEYISFYFKTYERKVNKTVLNLGPPTN